MYVLSLPAIYALELTSVCNNRCPGCSNIYAEQRTQTAPMSAGAWHELLAPLLPEAVQIRLTGGEPTLHPEFFTILEDVTSYDAWVTVFTNGRWHEPEALVSRLKGQWHLSGLLISLHGASATSHEAFTRSPGSFEETVRNIQLAVSQGIPVALSTVITRYSWNELEALVALGQELGVDHIAINRYIGRPIPSFSATLAQTRIAIETVQTLALDGAPIKYGIGVPQCFLPNDSEGCLAGVAYVSIDPWGRVRPCAHSPTVIGSLRNATMRKLWHSKAMKAWRGRVPQECTECAAYSVCHGGCRAIQELHPSGRDPLRRAPLDEFESNGETYDLPANGRPRVEARMRQESFGYVLLARGQVIPIRAKARPLIEACDGQTTFAELTSTYGQPGLNLLGELYASGLLELA